MTIKNFPYSTSALRLLVIVAFLSAARGVMAQASTSESQLLDRIRKLEQRLAAMEARFATQFPPESRAAAPAVAIGQPAARTAGQSASAAPADTQGATQPAITLPGRLELNAYFDGYYSWNANHPYNLINLLRAYDVLHNSFSINQTGIVLERPVNPSEGRRFGFRLDLMYGQATETLQGGTQNELRPQVYRPVFQAYGTYVAPLGRGLTVDFGKFASALGYENNFTKDQFTYSRSYLFNFLPFYHMGFRTSYPLSDKISLSYWLVNGAQQVEDFNHYKSNAFLFNFKPVKSVSWNVNYYVGREGREYVAQYNPDLPSVPSQPGLPVDVIRPVPDGRFHVLDSYASWSATDKLTFAGETDYVINRSFANSAPSRVIGGAAYANYAFTARLAAATRFEYFDDRDGLFSGVSQALKENTVALTFQPRPGFQLRGEWRRDFSNQPFFFTRTAGDQKREQNTAILGLIWWFGAKQGSW